MSKVKAGGTATSLTDSKPKFLGIKLNDGQAAQAGSIIVRQRGSKFIAGDNVGVGKDFTLFSLINGKVSFSQKRQQRFDGKTLTKNVVSVLAK